MAVVALLAAFLAVGVGVAGDRAAGGGLPPQVQNFKTECQR